MPRSGLVFRAPAKGCNIQFLVPTVFRLLVASGCPCRSETPVSPLMPGGGSLFQPVIGHILLNSSVHSLVE